MVNNLKKIFLAHRILRPRKLVHGANRRTNHCPGTDQLASIVASRADRTSLVRWQRTRWLPGILWGRRNLFDSTKPCSRFSILLDEGVQGITFMPNSEQLAENFSLILYILWRAFHIRNGPSKNETSTWELHEIMLWCLIICSHWSFDHHRLDSLLYDQIFS